MNLLTKIAIVLLCFSLCGAGTFIASTAQKDNAPQKTNLIPVYLTFDQTIGRSESAAKAARLLAAPIVAGNH